MFSISSGQERLAGPESRLVSRHVGRAAAAREPLAFAKALATASTPAGFVLDEEELAGDSPMTGAGETGDTSEMTVAEALAAFRGAHPNYRAASEDGVLVVEPQGTAGCQAALGRRVEEFSVRGSVLVVLDAVFRKVDPDHPAPPPGMMSMSGVLSVESLPFVNVGAWTWTVRQLLNEIARQAPGVVWVIRPVRHPPDERPACTFEFFYRSHRLSTGWKVPRPPAHMEPGGTPRARPEFLPRTGESAVARSAVRVSRSPESRGNQKGTLFATRRC